MSIIVCKNCGKKLYDRAQRCPHCGDVRTNENQPPQPPQTPQPPQQHQQTVPKPPTQQPPSAPTQSSSKAGGRFNSTNVIIIVAALVVGIGIGIAAILLTREDNEVKEPEPIEASYST
ncbi:MAG: zinc ribbon domain-containing protein, partial [Candidatus Limisoma sp.]|nr:zinc ribbon domain-containing protein [Candidatus Limisoma sp.]